MKSTSKVLAVLATVMLLGTITATTLLKQQASAQVTPDIKTKFNDLSQKFQQNVLGLLGGKTADPPGERIQALLIEYDNNVKELFGIKSSSDATPPEPDAQPPEPDKAGK